MEHAEARELLEDAAVEPGGFERLAAGDTPEAAALAGHLAGCPECAAAMEHLRRESTLIRDAVRSLPDPELRARTLAFVAAVGRERAPVGAPAAAGSIAAPAGPPAAAAEPVEHVHPPVAPPRFGRTGLLAASLAAVVVVVVAVVGTALLVGGTRQGDGATADQVAALTKVATWSLRIDGEPDARHVDLVAATGGGSAAGTLLYSPGTSELVVLAEGLTLPPAGQEYRCWMELGGERTRVGRMFFAGEAAFWVGDVDALAGATGDVRFGVTLVPADGDSVAGDPVLVGEP